MLYRFFFTIGCLFAIISIYPMQIESIHCITNGEILFDYSVYTGDIVSFEDRIVMANLYSIEEFELFENGTTERISFFETSASGNAILHVYQNRLYYFAFRRNLVEWYPNYYCRVFDLTQRPMIEIMELNFPEVITGYVPSFNFHDSYIYISFLGEQDYHITTKYDIEIFTFVGYVVPALGGYWVSIVDSTLLNMWTNQDGYYRLMFYSFENDQMSFQNDFILPLHQSVIINGTPHTTDGTKYVLPHTFGVTVVDFTDVMYPFITANIDVRDDFSDNIREVIYIDDFVVMSSTNKRICVYQINELGNFTFLWANIEDPFVDGGTTDIYVKDNFIFHQRFSDWIVLDISTGEELYRNNQNFNFSPFYSISPQQNDFYYNSFCWKTFSFDIYSVFQNELVVSVQNESQISQYTYHFHIENEKLYILLRRENNSYFEIYDIVDNYAHIANSVLLPSFSTFFIFINNTLFIETNNSVEVFSIDENQLIHLESLIGGLENRHTRHSFDFIITYIGRSISFRDVNNHNNILFNTLLPHAIGTISYIDSNYLLIYPPPPIGNERTAYIYKYNLTDNSISLFHSFPTLLGNSVSNFNTVITNNAYWKDSSDYFSILNNELTVIGEKQDKNREIWDTFFYPERNKMVQVAMSGIWVYDIEFEEYVSDDDIVILSTSNSLLGNYPNPFNPETTISFILQEDANVKIDIYNIRGQKVKSLVNDFKTSGSHQAVWNGTDDKGQSVGSGIYFYQLTCDSFKQTRKMVLLK